ncbi:hypothetical protein [Mesonia sp.]|uniref:hypothetical protein n=1 Tax=Mesonia sp. TaxID=1960830 RepID=UPI0017542294|nr:hypothetical protein [Mesonia sp.]HIB35956.1 hypothetical protein [Mesonia sp.]
MKKFFKNLVYFLFGYFLIVQIINFLAPYHWGNPWYSSKIQYLESKNLVKDYNLYFFGSSRVYRQIDPVIIDRELKKKGFKNINSFNLGSPATFSPQSYFLYEKFLESDLSKNVKFAVVELNSIDGIGSKRLHEERTYYYQNFSDLVYVGKSLSAQETLFNRKNINIYSKYLISYVEQNVLPANFKHLWIDDNFYKKSYLGKNKNGYFSLDEELSTSTDSVFKNYLRTRKRKLSLEKLQQRENLNFKLYSDYKKIKIDEKKANKIVLDRINKLITLSKEKGIHLIFMISSRASSNELKELSNFIPEPNFIDMANPSESEYSFMYSLENSFDVGHLNNLGAKKYSKALADKIGQIIN